MIKQIKNKKIIIPFFILLLIFAIYRIFIFGKQFGADIFDLFH